MGPHFLDSPFDADHDGLGPAGPFLRGEARARAHEAVISYVITSSAGTIATAVVQNFRHRGGGAVQSEYLRGR